MITLDFYYLHRRSHGARCDCSLAFCVLKYFIFEKKRVKIGVIFLLFDDYSKRIYMRFTFHVGFKLSMNNRMFCLAVTFSITKTFSGDRGIIPATAPRFYL